jgi:hypothetical protein
MDFNTEIAKQQIDLSLEGIDAPLLDNPDPEFDESLGLDLSSLTDSDLYNPEADEFEEAEVSVPSLEQDIIRFLSENPSCVTALHKNPEAALEFISEQLDLDGVIELYRSNPDFNVFINAIAQGFLVSDNFVKVIPNTVKIFFITSELLESIHLRNLANINMYKSTPAIFDFKPESINALGSVYKQHQGTYKSLYNYLQAYCYKPVVGEKNSISVLDFDDMTIAKSIVKSSKGITAGLNKLKAAGCDQSRLNRLTVLAKALRDSKQ